MLSDPILVALAVVALGLVGFFAYRFGLGFGHDDEVKRLEEYDFYPFTVNESRHIEFSPEQFNEAVGYFLDHRNSIAARELIVIGEQNFVRDRFATPDVDEYRRLYERYDGDSVISDNEAYLENYKRIVSLLGRSFPNTGIEILLHNLVNPSRSIVTLENGEVTGRKLEMGATNLVLDLKTRRYQNQDKLNYELNIGSRQFKCTTIPIYRGGLRVGRGGVHQHRRPIHPGGGALQSRTPRRLHRQPVAHRDGARGEHPLPRRVPGRAAGQAPLSRRGDSGQLGGLAAIHPESDHVLRHRRLHAR